MKKIFAIVLLPLLLGVMISCTDVKGDGMGTVIWQGSTVPQDSSFRNPVWEPDLSYPSVYKAAVGFYAIGSDKEWSPGLKLTAPVLSSTNLMSWDQRGEALAEGGHGGCETHQHLHHSHTRARRQRTLQR